MITMKHILLFFLLWVSATHASKACSCSGPSDFISTVSKQNFPPGLIVRGEKTADHHYGMKFRIKEVLKGEENRSEITVWGDNGALCRVYASGFAVGEELILALYKTDKMGNSISASEYPENLEKDGDYALSICGVHYLRAKNSQVTGPITASESSMHYTKFKHHLGVTEPVPGEGEAFLVYPNPARFGLFKISYNLPETTELTVSLYNVIGMEVKKLQFDLLKESGTIEIDTQDVRTGVYFVEITGEGLKKTERIIIL